MLKGAFVDTWVFWAQVAALWLWRGPSSVGSTQKHSGIQGTESPTSSQVCQGIFKIKKKSDSKRRKETASLFPLESAPHTPRPQELCPACILDTLWTPEGHVFVHGHLVNPLCVLLTRRRLGAGTGPLPGSQGPSDHSSKEGPERQRSRGPALQDPGRKPGEGSPRFGGGGPPHTDAGIPHSEALQLLGFGE